MGSANSIGKVIRIVRIANDQTVAEAAELQQISQGYLSEVESGKKNLGLGTFKKIAKAYNLAPFQLMELVEYYESLNNEELKKYQFTLIKALEMILLNSNKQHEET